jgi:hypothetical protein
MASPVGGGAGPAAQEAFRAVGLPWDTA